MNQPPQHSDEGHDEPARPAAQPSPLAGLLVIDKPLNRTSMHVCAVVRAMLRRGGAPKGVKVGHGGTLDPLATGVLVVLVGKATPLCNVIMAGRKAYEARVDLSRVSPTHDHERPSTIVEVASPPMRDAVDRVLASFVGTIEQTPPEHSAINLGGQRAYAMAREGLAVPVSPRPVVIHSIDVLDYSWPMLSIRVSCGKGTYLRSLARDVGASLGTGGVLDALRRTEAAPFTIDQAVPLDSLQGELRQADLLPIPEQFRSAPAC